MAPRSGERAFEGGKVSLVERDDDAGDYLLAVTMGRGTRFEVN